MAFATVICALHAGTAVADHEQYCMIMALRAWWPLAGRFLLAVLNVERSHKQCVLAVQGIVKVFHLFTDPMTI